MFDLDGTLLPIDENAFVKGYLSLIGDYMIKYGYDKKELISDILNWTKLMTINNGEKTNYEVFWQEFAKKYSEEKLADIPEFDKFYVTEFKKTAVFCKPTTLSRQIIDYCKSKGVSTVLATNPFFPKKGIVTRLGFVGLSENDFDYITSYENSCYSKASSGYYSEILNKLSLSPSEVLMFGNSEDEDCKNSAAVGIKSFLVSENGDNGIKLDEIPEILERELGDN